jgi:alpha-D-ribose 1-methylphosphonate 5-triphosphate synthase subunit PhnH
MQENSEEWMQLREAAASEQDPEQLMTLVEQISVLLEAREQRLKGPSIRPPTEVPKGSWLAPAH